MKTHTHTQISKEKGSSLSPRNSSAEETHCNTMDAKILIPYPIISMKGKKTT